MRIYRRTFSTEFIPSLKMNWPMLLAEVARSSNYSLVPFGGLFWTFVYVLAAQTSAGQAGPKFKAVCQRV